MNSPIDRGRPIDKLRSRGGSLEISTPDDDSAIWEIITTADRLLVVKGKGIYEIKLADQVDPERTNIGVPNTIQRILPYGAQDSWIGAEIVHPKTPLPKVSVNSFFTATLKELVRVVELMVVFLCARHVTTVAGFPVQVVEVPQGRRRSPHVRYGYGTIIGDQIVPTS